MEGHARPDVRRTRHGSDRAARTGGSRASLTFRLQAVTARRPDPLLGAAARPRARAQCQARPRNRPGSASGRSPKRSSARTAGDAPTRRTKHSLTGASERIKLPHGHLHHRVRRPPQIAPRWHPCRAPKATAPTQIGTPERSKPPHIARPRTSNRTVTHRCLLGDALHGVSDHRVCREPDRWRRRGERLGFRSRGPGDCPDKAPQSDI